MTRRKLLVRASKMKAQQDNLKAQLEWALNEARRMDLHDYDSTGIYKHAEVLCSTLSNIRERHDRLLDRLYAQD